MRTILAVLLLVGCAAGQTFHHCQLVGGGASQTSSSLDYDCGAAHVTLETDRNDPLTMKSSGDFPPVLVSSPEPIDVPAVQPQYQNIIWPEHRISAECPKEFEMRYAPDCHGSICYESRVECYKPPRCDDPKRGLWHDEQDPPKYWCRKVQP